MRRISRESRVEIAYLILMRALAVLCAIAGVAAAKPVWRPPPPRTDAQELAARLAEAIRSRDARAVEAMLSDSLTYDGLWFANPACAKQFGTRGTAEQGAVRALAKCLAQQRLIATTRRSGVPGGAVLTFAPGIELELVFTKDRVTYAGGLYPRDADRGLPTLTVQAFEALRTAGTTQLDAALAGKLTDPASAWVKVCLDPRGAASTFVASVTPPAARDAFLAAIADWRFAPFAPTRGTPIAACALSLLTYPAARAPAIEVLPRTPRASIGSLIESDASFDFTGISISGSSSAPQSVPPVLLERNRIRGARQIDPDTATTTAIAKAGRSTVVASLKLCLNAKGQVTTVRRERSSGFPAYDAKLVREVRSWAFRPYLIAGTPAAVCSTVTFVYRAKP